VPRGSPLPEVLRQRHLPRLVDGPAGIEHLLHSRRSPAKLPRSTGEPIAITTTTVVKARSIFLGCPPSATITPAYFIDEHHAAGRYLTRQRPGQLAEAFGGPAVGGLRGAQVQDPRRSTPSPYLLAGPGIGLWMGGQQVPGARVRETQVAREFQILEYLNQYKTTKEHNISSKYVKKVKFENTKK